MTGKPLVAAVEGVFLKVGDHRQVTLGKDAPVPEGADPEHVAILVERGLLVEPDESDTPVEDHSAARDPAVPEGADAEQTPAKAPRK